MEILIALISCSMLCAYAYLEVADMKLKHKGAKFIGAIAMTIFFCSTMLFMIMFSEQLDKLVNQSVEQHIAESLK
jgi:hypothetical protein